MKFMQVSYNLYFSFLLWGSKNCQHKFLTSQNNLIIIKPKPIYSEYSCKLSEIYIAVIIKIRSDSHLMLCLSLCVFTHLMIKIYFFYHLDTSLPRNTVLWQNWFWFTWFQFKQQSSRMYISCNLGQQYTNQLHTRPSFHFAYFLMA